MKDLSLASQSYCCLLLFLFPFFPCMLGTVATLQGLSSLPYNTSTMSIFLKPLFQLNVHSTFPNPVFPNSVTSFQNVWSTAKFNIPKSKLFFFFFSPKYSLFLGSNYVAGTTILKTLISNVTLFSPIIPILSYLSSPKGIVLESQN